MCHLPQNGLITHISTIGWISATNNSYFLQSYLSVLAEIHELGSGALQTADSQLDLDRFLSLLRMTPSNADSPIDCGIWTGESRVQRSLDVMMRQVTYH